MAVLDQAPQDPTQNGPPGPPQPDTNPNPDPPTTPQGPPQPTENPNPEPPTTTNPGQDPSNPSPANPTGDNSSSGNAAFRKLIEDTIAAELGKSPTTTTKTVHEPEVDQAKAIYFKIWGVMPPHGYIEGLVHQGLNVYEIASNEMAKPAFAQTRSYRDQWASYAEQVATVFGRR